MPKETVALASDHAGVELKDILKSELAELGFEALDLGTNSNDSVDYPDYGRAIAEAIADGRAAMGVAVCGSGIGISIAANRVQGVRAALCHNSLDAELSRQHNDANILALGARTTDANVAKDCLSTFLNTKFEGGRHQKRVDKLG